MSVWFRRAGGSSQPLVVIVVAVVLVLLFLFTPGWSATAIKASGRLPHRHRVAGEVGVGLITTVAGSGAAGYSGDGGPAVAALLNEPRTMTFDANGALYIADTFNHVVRKVDASGVIHTFAGAYAGPTGVTEENCPSEFGGDGGPAGQASLRCPHSVVVDSAGGVIIADSGNNRIRRVDAAGIITTIAGIGDTGFSGDGGPATQARIQNPKGVALDRDGNLLIADSGNNRIRRVDPFGIITTIAGTGIEADSGDGGPAAQASLNRPRTVAVTDDGTILVAEPWTNRIRRIDARGVISTIAGTGLKGFSGDGGIATKAQLDTPRGVAADHEGNVFIADSLNNRIRKVDRNGIITTIAGGSRRAFEGDGGPPDRALLAGPRAVVVAPNSDLYIADTYNFRIRRISGQSGAVAPLAVAPPPPPAPVVEPPPPVEAMPFPPRRSGYWMITSAGGVHVFGDAVNLGGGPPGAVDVEPTPSGEGYWILSNDGQVSPSGDATPFMPVGLNPGEKAVSLSATPSGQGYRVFTDKGRAITRGDASFKGDMSDVRLNGPVLGSVATPTGEGYWMVASDGGIFSFGDANFYGSMGGQALNRPVASMAPEPDGEGYWLVASDGGVFAFNAPFHGSTASLRLNRPISGIVPGDAGYLMVAQDGGIFAFGHVAFHGSLGATPPPAPVVAVALLP